jgi:hypothetical protein
MLRLLEVGPECHVEGVARRCDSVVDLLGIQVRDGADCDVVEPAELA